MQILLQSPGCRCGALCSTPIPRQLQAHSAPSSGSPVTLLLEASLSNFVWKPQPLMNRRRFLVSWSRMKRRVCYLPSFKIQDHLGKTKIRLHVIVIIAPLLLPRLDGPACRAPCRALPAPDWMLPRTILLQLSASTVQCLSRILISVQRRMLLMACCKRPSKPKTRARHAARIPECFRYHRTGRASIDF